MRKLAFALWTGGLLPAQEVTWREQLNEMSSKPGGWGRIPAEICKENRNFTVQDLDLVAKEITYRLEVWQTSDGQVVRANLPAELNGQHFGPTLKAYISSLYAHGVTQPAIHEVLEGLGFEISTGTVSDILLDEAEQHSAVSKAILSAGLQGGTILSC